jgi:hypothetical protein
MIAEHRVRWLAKSVVEQTGQSHPTTGTPTDVPVPKKMNCRAGFDGKSPKGLVMRVQYHGVTVLSQQGEIFPEGRDSTKKLRFYPARFFAKSTAA